MKPASKCRELKYLNGANVVTSNRKRTRRQRTIASAKEATPEHVSEQPEDLESEEDGEFAGKSTPHAFMTLDDTSSGSESEESISQDQVAQVKRSVSPSGLTPQPGTLQGRSARSPHAKRSIPGISSARGAHRREKDCFTAVTPRRGKSPAHEESGGGLQVGSPELLERVSPPRDMRPASRARYAPAKPSMIAERAPDGQLLIDKLRAWVQGECLWIQHDGGTVHVTPSAVVDAIMAPAPCQMLTHHEVPVMLICSAVQNSSDFANAHRAVCFEREGQFEAYKEALPEGYFMHVIPVIMLQACELGQPAVGDKVLKDIDSYLHDAQPASPSLHQANGTGLLSPSRPRPSLGGIDLTAGAAAKANVSELQDPERAGPGRFERIADAAQVDNARGFSPLKRKQVVAGEQAALHPGHPQTSLLAQESNCGSQHAEALNLLDAYIQRFPKLRVLMDDPENRKHVLELWVGSAAMQEYGSSSLFTLAYVLTGHPIEYFRSDMPRNTT